jgi:hypothetical protein
MTVRRFIALMTAIWHTRQRDTLTLKNGSVLCVEPSSEPLTGQRDTVVMNVEGRHDVNVDILGKSYEVMIVDEIHAGGNMGNANRSLQKITISSYSAHEQQQDTLMHEILHIIDGELKVGLTEEDISRLAVGLYSAGYRHSILVKL